MNKDNDLMGFLENIIKSRGLLSLTYNDFSPIESIIDYRRMTYKDECTSIEYNNFCGEYTNRIIININPTKSYTYEMTQKIINFIKSQFINENVEILLGELFSENETEITVDIILYK